MSYNNYKMKEKIWKEILEKTRKKQNNVINIFVLFTDS